MAKYIDADALKRWIQAECNPYGAPTLDYASSVKIMERIGKMPAADVELVGKWISVDERLPETRIDKEYHGGNFTGEPREVIENTISDPVLVAIKDWHNRIIVGTDFVYDGEWFNYNDRDIIAWMPLPEPPKNGRK